MPQMRKTLIPHQKKVLRSLQLRKIQKNPQIQLAKQKSGRNQSSIKSANRKFEEVKKSSKNALKN